MNKEQKNSAGRFTIRAIRGGDVAALLQLWRGMEGIGLSQADTPAAIQTFLERNPDFSAAAVAEDGRVIGSALCGHDGRRGYLYHLAVRPEYQRQGVAKGLLDYCLERLAGIGIGKCNACVYAANEKGREFWRRCGWVERSDLVLVQKTLG